MTDERWRQIEDLFAQALECPAPERHAFLDRVCGSDRELRRELESLLEFDTPDERLVDVSELREAVHRGASEADPDLAGQRVGPYRLIRVIGHGGMGTVYLGVRDDDQYQKQVAIKLLKRGMDTDFMLTRFRQERQILANLEHPFIARLIDGGATETGLPYFVMEYVDGVPITTYCAEKKLSTTERLRLFRLVCEAIQHAHQNLVVHRDVKPSNILTTHEGIPKLLDFGIAKVLSPEGPSGATLTQREQRMLTPDYASPEQVQGLAMSTASDIYSLGAVLYELLSGQRPHRFPSNSLADLERTICEIEPEKPSAAVDRDPEMPAGARKQLKRELAGDLDNIVLAALRKDPQRRYASAAEFSDDLRRHLEALPIRAQEDRWGSRARKFIRRNKLVVGAAALIVVSLIGGIVATTIQARRAERRFQMVRGLANQMLFEVHDEMEKIPGSTALRVKAVQTVVKYLDALAADGAQDPNLELEIAIAYERAGNLEGHPYLSNLGRSDAALVNYQKALAVFERVARDPALRAAALRGLIDTHLKAAQLEGLMGKPVVAKAHVQKALGLADEALALGDAKIPFSTQFNVYQRLADSEYDQGSSAGEAKHYRKALEVAQRWDRAEHSPASIASLQNAYRNLGSALARGGTLTEALDSFRHAYQAASDMQRRTDLRQNQSYNTISILTSMGDILAAPDDPNLNDPKAALVHYRNALMIAEQLAATDVNNVNARRMTAVCNQRVGMNLMESDPAQALIYYQKSLTIADELHTADPRNAEYRYHAARAEMGIGETLRHLHRDVEAIQHLNRAIEIQNAVAAVSPERIWNLRVLSRSLVLKGQAQLAAGDTAGSLNTLRDGLATAERMLARAPTSLAHQLDRANALEALGAHYQQEAARTVSGDRKAELQREARRHFEASLSIWKSWTKQKLALPYASRRESRATALLTAIH